jgi:hypothetical protein
MEILMMLMEVQKRALQKACDLIAGMGLTYAIRGDGIELGSLQVHEPAGERHPNGRKKRDTQRFIDYKVRDRLMLLVVGEVEVFQIIAGDDDMTPAALQSNVAGHANRIFGSGNYSTAICEDTVQVIREA